MSAIRHLFTQAATPWTVGRMFVRPAVGAMLGTLVGVAPAAIAATHEAGVRHALPLRMLVPEGAIAASLPRMLGARLAPLGLSLQFAVAADEDVRARLETMAASGAAPPDLVLIDDADLRPACAEGLLVPVDASGSCGVVGPVERTVLGSNEGRDGSAPNWSGFWDLARLPGRRGLPRRSAGVLEIALLADGVARADIYDVLARPAGVRRAFRKLAQLRPYIVWWQNGADAMRVLASGAVRMTAAPASSLAVAAAASHPPITVQWADFLSERTSWAIPARAPHAAAARQVLDLLADRQVATSLQATEPAPADGATGLVIDDAFWAEHPGIARRFATWLAR